MISTAYSLPQPAPTPLRSPGTPRPAPASAVGQNMASEEAEKPLDITLTSGKEQARDLAYKRLERAKARMDVLKLMAKIDPKTALKLAAEIAREMKSAVKAYAEAGGRNVSAGDLALIRKQATDAMEAREAADAAGIDTTAMDAQIKSLDAREEDAMADHGFFEEVKRLVAGLKKARQDIRGEAVQSTRPPSEEDWKAADRDQAELEREIDRAASGPAVSIRV
jgi:cell division FtsZ-interacting protein ZapD